MNTKTYIRFIVALGVIASINSLICSVLQQIHQLKTANLENVFTFFISAIIAFIGFFIIVKIVSETKKKHLYDSLII